MKRLLLLTVALSLIGSSPALADSIARGHLVKVEDKEIYFDIGSSSKLEVGDRLRIKRSITLKHPVTRAAVSDWLPIGSARVTMVGSTLSMAKLTTPLLAQVKVGDRVEVLVVEPVKTVARPKPAPPAEPKPRVEPKPARRVDPDTAKVLAVWRAGAGRTIDARISAWEGYLEANPDSKLAPAVREDVRALRLLRDKLRPPELSLGQMNVTGVDHQAPRRARPNTALPLVFVLEQPDQIAAGWLHYRTRGRDTFVKTRLRAEGDGYLRATIPADAIHAPGLEYFAEIANTRGLAGATAGSANAPTTVQVAGASPLDAFKHPARRSRISLNTSYLDFATFDTRPGKHTDRFFMLEADFAYRLRQRVHAVRAGFGVIQGRGGFADQVYDSTTSAPKAGFNYGYAEAEIRGAHNTALMTRLVAGVGREGFGMGIDLRGRLGKEDGTSLTLGVESIAEIGFLTEMRMRWNALPRFPLALGVGVTDQPSQGDLGVRLTCDLGYRMGWVTPTVRISYQARNTEHAGLGAGLGLVFDW